MKYICNIRRYEIYIKRLTLSNIYTVFDARYRERCNHYMPPTASPAITHTKKKMVVQVQALFKNN